jgi:ferrous iron transport protein A
MAFPRGAFARSTWRSGFKQKIITDEIENRFQFAILGLDFIDAPTSELAMSAHTAEWISAERGISLATLGPGSVAVILDVDRASPEGRRLLDLGFVPDTEIRVMKRAPLGDPMVYFLRGTHLCLRRTEADRVRVRPV